MTAFDRLMNHFQPGTMVQHLFSMSAGADWSAGLAVRESSLFLEDFPRRIDIHSRGAVLQTKNVYLILLMLKFEGEIYETFVSIQHEDSEEFVARMAEQPYFWILLFDGISPLPVRTFVTQNSFQDLFQYVAQSMSDWPAWCTQEFDEAKAELYGHYPTVQALWQALENRTSGTEWILSSPGNN